MQTRYPGPSPSLPHNPRAQVGQAGRGGLSRDGVEAFCVLSLHFVSRRPEAQLWSSPHARARSLSAATGSPTELPTLFANARTAAVISSRRWSLPA